MARYYWDITHLRKDYDKLVKAMNLESDPLEKLKLSKACDVVNSVLFEEFIRPDNFISLQAVVTDMYSSFLLEQRYFELLEVFLDPIEGHLELYNDTCKNMDHLEEEINRVTNCHVGRCQAVSICHDFYQGLDEELYSYFEPFYKERYGHLKFVKDIAHDDASLTCGRAYYLYGLGTNYVQVLGKDNPEMAMTLIHESAHVIDSNMNPEAFLNETYFYEVVSLFMEYVSIYEKTGNFDELFYHGHQIKRISSFFADANVGSDLGTLMSIFKMNDYRINQDFYSLAKKEYDFTRSEVKETLVQGNYNDVVYPISFTLATYFFHIYKQDKRLGLLELKKFLRTVNRDSYIPLILSTEMSSVLEEEVNSLFQSSDEVFSKKIKCDRR